MSTGLLFHLIELVPEVIEGQNITGEAKAFSAFVKLMGQKWVELSFHSSPTNQK